MFRSRWLLLPLCIFMLSLTAAAQDTADDPYVPDVVDYFIASDRDFSFGHPADWRTEEDGPRTYFIEHPDADLRLLIELLPVSGERLISTFQDEEETAELPTPAQLIDLFFGEANYSTPQTFEIDAETERDAARIGDEREDIYALYLSPPDTFALVFVQGADRADYEDDLGFMLRTLRPGLPVIETTGDDEEATEAQANFAAGAETASLALADGELNFAYPADWLFADLGEGIGSLENEDGTALMLLLADLTVAFDLFGGQGNLDDITSAEDLLEAVIAADDTFDAEIQTSSIDQNMIARIDVTDDVSDNALIAVETAEGQLLLLLASTDPGLLPTIETLLEGVIGSVIYTD